jgi:hypothetical protein
MNRKMSFILAVAVLFNPQVSYSASLDQRLKSCLDGTLKEQEKIGLVKALSELERTFSTYVETNSAACYTKLTGQPSDFSNGTGLVTSIEDIAEIRRLRKEAGAEEELRSRLEAKIPYLEKQKSCVSTKVAQVNTNLEAIDNQFEIRNQALILDDTHKACIELYSSDKSAAMLSQTCIEAFQRKGHPSLVFSESEQLANLGAELLKLIELEEGLEEELISTKIQLLETKGSVKREEFNQKIADELEAKSCAEFGYEGVYLE